jgi:hypothetical protein
MFMSFRIPAAGRVPARWSLDKRLSKIAVTSLHQTILKVALSMLCKTKFNKETTLSAQ